MGGGLPGTTGIFAVADFERLGAPPLVSTAISVADHLISASGRVGVYCAATNNGDGDGGSLMRLLLLETLRRAECAHD